MKTTSFNRELLKDILVFGGILTVLVVLWNFVGVPGAHAALIDISDNPGKIAAAMVIYGGILYVTSAGEEEKTGKAKKILMYAIIGIVIIFLSFAIVNTVISGAGTGDETVS